ncbi:MAG: hypothetical protein ABIF82_05375 [Planctomycetota bacterium]
MLAATTAPAAASLASNIWGLLSNVCAAGIGATAGALCTYFAIKRAYRHQIVAERRLDVYLRLDRLLRAACDDIKDWSKQYDHANMALAKARSHCAIHAVLLGKIAPEFIDFYDEVFTTWYKLAVRSEATKKFGPPPIEKPMSDTCCEFRDKARRIIDQRYPVDEPDL